MNKILYALCPLTSALCLLSATALAQTQPKPAVSGTAPEPVVEMAPYIVSADRILPNPETWTLVKVPALDLIRGNRHIVAPGYEILSNLPNTSDTKALVGQLQLLQFAGDYLWPMITQSLPRTAVYVVADIRLAPQAPSDIVKTSDAWKNDPIDAANIQPSPGSFNSSVSLSGGGVQQISALGSTDFNASYGLAQSEDINAANDPSQIANDDNANPQNDVSDMANRQVDRAQRDESIIRPLPPGYVELAMNGGPLAALIRAGSPLAGVDRFSEERYAATLSYYLDLYALNSLPQKPPAWFARGLGNLLGSTQVTYQQIDFAKITEDFMDMAMPKLSAIFQKGPDDAFTEPEDRLAALFVHYGLFGEDGKYAARMMQFVNALAAGAKPTDALFKQAFGISMTSMETNLAAAGRSMSFYKSMKTTGPIPEMPAATYREATQSEVARIKAEMYVSQANPAKALDELRTAYWRGEREPEMLAFLAFLEEQIGSDARARKLAQTLMALPDPPARACIVSAKLKLKDAFAGKPADAKLAPDETAGLITTLGGAMKSGPTEDLCAALAEVVLKSASRPDPNILAFLQQAAKRYPQNASIASAAKL